MSRPFFQLPLPLIIKWVFSGCWLAHLKFIHVQIWLPPVFDSGIIVDTLWLVSPLIGRRCTHGLRYIYILYIGKHDGLKNQNALVYMFVCVRVCHCIYYEYIVLCTVYHSISTCTCVFSHTYCPLGVQGEVYQADLPGTGLVAVKISRRNDDYAKGGMAKPEGRVCARN